MTKMNHINKNRIVVLLVSLFPFYSCETEKEYVPNEIIHIELQNNKPQELSDIFSKIELIPLETNDSCLVGRPFLPKNVISMGNRGYIVIDANHVAFSFDSIGNAISNSHHCIGIGPEQYNTMQDILYDKYADAISIYDPFGNLYMYTTDFKLVEKKKISLEKGLMSIKSMSVVDRDIYAFFDRNLEEAFYLYKIKENKKVKVCKYPGRICGSTMNTHPFYESEENLYYCPPEYNNNIFRFNRNSKELELLFTVIDDKSVNSKEDIDAFKNDRKAISKYITRESTKYSLILRMFNNKYLLSIYNRPSLSNPSMIYSIYNLTTSQNAVLTMYEGGIMRFPVIFEIEDSVLYACVYPHELSGCIDESLVSDKSILRSIAPDDNPVIVKYHLKF